MVYGARLESVWAKVRRGSNPLPSASLGGDGDDKLRYEMDKMVGNSNKFDDNGNGSGGSTREQKF